MKKIYTIEREDDNLLTYLPLQAFLKYKIINQEKYTDNEVEIIFLDTEELDYIYPSQEKALNYIIENSEKICTALNKFIFAEREELEEVFGLFDEACNAGFPNLNSANEIYDYLNISTIYIHKEERQGFSYIGLHGDCTWDTEHAFGAVFHKNRIVDFGDWNTASSFYKERKNLKISTIYSLDSLSERKENLEKIAKNIKVEKIDEYLHLFNWLIAQRAIYGYRSTKNDLTDLEKVALLLHIEYLDLSCKKLSNLPSSLSLLSKLTYLDISRNMFCEVPSSVKKLKNISYLDLSFNKLSKIPAWISLLTKLKKLDMSYNKISNIPSHILNMHSLKTIQAANNSFSLFQKFKLSFWVNKDVEL